MRPDTRTVVVLAMLTLALSAPAAAQWRQCASDLDQLRIAIQEAHEEARRASSTERELRNRQDEFFRCLRIPAVNDFLNSGCRNQQTAYQTADMRHNAAFDIAREALDALAFSVQTVELSCEFPLAAMVPVLADPVERSPECQSFLRRRQGVPRDALRVLCEGEMLAEECAVCLGEPR